MLQIPEDFDWKIYLDLNPDLRKAGLGTKRQAIYHYFHYGIKQKREYKKIEKNTLKTENTFKSIDKIDKKFLIATVAWRRPEILDIFIRVNKKYCDVLVVKSPEDELLKDYKDFENVFFIEYPNKPLGKKLNKRIEWFMEKEKYTHIIFLGSDNIISPEIFNFIKEKSKDYDLISWKDIYFHDIETKESQYFSGYRNKPHNQPMAPGKCLSKNLLSEIGYIWSNDINKNPDINSWSNKLHKVKNQIILSCKDVSGYIVDIKSNENINSYSKVKNSFSNLVITNKKETLDLKEIIYNVK